MTMRLLLRMEHTTLKWGTSLTTPVVAAGRESHALVRAVKAAVILVAFIAAPLMGCGMIPTECSAVGCENLVVFDLKTDLRNEVTYEVKACVDDKCSRATIEVAAADAEGVVMTGLEDQGILVLTDSDEIHFSLPEGDYSGEHRLRLNVRTSEGDVLADIDQQTAFERNYPNGSSCEPVCWFAEITA